MPTPKAERPSPIRAPAVMIEAQSARIANSFVLRGKLSRRVPTLLGSAVRLVCNRSPIVGFLGPLGERDPASELREAPGIRGVIGEDLGESDRARCRGTHPLPERQRRLGVV